MGSNSFKKGDNAIIITSLAQELIEEGVCEENKSLTLRDKIVQDAKEEAKEEESEEEAEVKAEEPSEEKPRRRRNNK